MVLPGKTEGINKIRVIKNDRILSCVFLKMGLMLANIWQMVSCFQYLLYPFVSTDALLYMFIKGAIPVKGVY